MTDQNNSNTGGFTLGFGLGAAAGAAFAYFLQSEDGKKVKQEFSADFQAVKKELVRQGLLPSTTLSFPELISHVVTHMAEYIDLDDTSTAPHSKGTKTKKKNTATLARKVTKRKQQTFSGV